MGELRAISSETDLIDRAYAAALDDSLWHDWAGDLIFALGGAGGTFMIWDEDSAVTRAHNYTIDQNIREEHRTDWWPRNPQDPALAAFARPGVHIGSDQGAGSWRHHMSGVALLGEAGARATISVHRMQADGPPPSRDQARFAAILPDMTRAMNLGFRASETLLDSFWEGVQAQQSERSALLIDERGRVIRMTASAEALKIGRAHV